MPFEKSLDDPQQTSQNVCMHLRSKGMFVTGVMDPGLSHESASGHCWCNRTQNVFGPDSQVVARRQCISGRQCFEELL